MSDIAELVRSQLVYFPQDGKFKWRASWRDAGYTRPDGYVCIRIAGVLYLRHRLVWLYVYGKWPEHTIDHINLVKGDDRLENLRDVPHQVNCRNQPLRSNNRTGIAGVQHHQGRYLLRMNGKYIGMFASVDEAAKRKQELTNV